MAKGAGKKLAAEVRKEQVRHAAAVAAKKAKQEQEEQQERERQGGDPK